MPNWKTAQICSFHASDLGAPQHRPDSGWRQIRFNRRSQIMLLRSGWTTHPLTKMTTTKSPKFAASTLPIWERHNTGQTAHGAKSDSTIGHEIMLLRCGWTTHPLTKMTLTKSPKFAAFTLPVWEHHNTGQTARGAKSDSTIGHEIMLLRRGWTTHLLTKMTLTSK